MKIKREAVAYFGNLVPEKGLPVSKKPHVPSPLVSGESRPVKSTVNAKKKQTVPTDDLPDLKDKDVQNAAVQIQAAFRGFQSRKEVAKKKQSAGDVIHAAFVIQRAFKRYKKRKELEELPDLKANDVVAATIKIQSAYKGFKTRRNIQKHKEALPDLNLAEVQEATLKIQRAYRGFKTRK